MLQKLIQIWKIKDLRKSILFVLGMLIVFRFAAHIPLPGVNVDNLRDFFANNQILGFINVLSGGGMQNFSIVLMGVAPYITASIIFQLLVMIVPRLEELQKEPNGQQKINQYTRYLTVPLAILQGFGMVKIFNQSAQPIITDLNTFKWVAILSTVTAGSMFLVWIGELISEKKIGNGISLLIFAGIISSLPTALGQAIAIFDKTQLFKILVFAGIAVVTVIGVVIITEAQRNVPVSYAKRIRGTRMYGGMDTHLPLRVNMAGVIPIIFAISIILFPPMMANFFMNAKSEFLVKAAEFVVAAFNNLLVYGVLYFVLVVAFTFFYTYVIFHPKQVADNLQKQGGFIHGIRPGKPTSEYLNYTVNRIILVGALFLGLIAVLPIILRQLTDIQALTIGGTSLLIVVSVVIEMVKQIESQLTMRDYEGL